MQYKDKKQNNLGNTDSVRTACMLYVYLVKNDVATIVP